MEEIYWLICPGGGSLPISFLSSCIPRYPPPRPAREAGLERCPVDEDSSSFIKPFCVSAFPGDSVGKESAHVKKKKKKSAHNAGDLGLIPGLGRSLGEGKSYPLQCSGLENSVDRIVHGAEKSWTRLRTFTFTFLRLQPHCLLAWLHTLVAWFALVGGGGTGQLRGLRGGRLGATGEFSGSRSRGWHRF